MSKDDKPTQLDDSTAPTLPYYTPPRVTQSREDRDREVCTLLLVCTALTFPLLCVAGGFSMLGALGMAVAMVVLAGLTTGYAHAAQKNRTKRGLAPDQLIDAAFGLGAMLLIFASMPLLILCIVVLLAL